MPLLADPNSRLTREQALDILPDVVIGLLQHHLVATIHDRGAGNRAVMVVGRGLRIFLHIADWNLLSDNITFDPETSSTLGAPDPDSPPPPNSVTPFQLGSLLTVKGTTAANRRFNPRTPINRQLLLRKDGSFRALIVQRIGEIF